MAKKKHTGSNPAASPQPLAPMLALLETIDRRVREMEAVANSLEGTERLRRSVDAKKTAIDAVFHVASELMAFEATLYQRWTRREKQQAKEAAQEIVGILSADKVDRDAAEAWFARHGPSIGAGMLAAIIERAIKDAMMKTSAVGTQGRTARAKTKERCAIALELWSANPSIAKIDLAFEISDRCAKHAEQAKARGEEGWHRWQWAVPSVRRWLQGKTLADLRRISATE